MKLFSRPLARSPFRPFAFLLLTTFTTTATFQNGALAFSVGSGATASGNIAGQLGQIAESAGPVQSFQADLFTGRAQTSASTQKFRYRA